MRPHRRAAALLALLVAAACAGPRPAAERPPLRVATWNLHDLFDEVRQTDASGEQVPAPEAVREKLSRLGAVLRALDADVVAVQEVENAPLLARLGGREYRAILEEGTDPRGIDVGLLTRVRVAGAASHGDPLFPRPPLEVRLDGGGREVVVVVAHLKSKVGGAPSDDRRERQARRLRAIADAAAARAPRALVVVAGDLNDEPGSAPLAPLLADGAWVDVAARDRDAWTYRYQGRRQRLDYVLVRAPDAARVRAVRTADAGGASDHRPLVVDLSP